MNQPIDPRFPSAVVTARDGRVRLDWKLRPPEVGAVVLYLYDGRPAAVYSVDGSMSHCQWLEGLPPDGLRLYAAREAARNEGWSFELHMLLVRSVIARVVTDKDADDAAPLIEALTRPGFNQAAGMATLRDVTSGHDLTQVFRRYLAAERGV